MFGSYSLRILQSLMWHSANPEEHTGDTYCGKDEGLEPRERTSRPSLPFLEGNTLKPDKPGGSGARL